ncbi:hypothetical protein, partial [Vibrio parahaemolyticus]|uniref:hypothetical protein n=1 Tax=Vibrio parahaemolyticus TaxID=670 RepID=UPI001F2EA3C4
RVTTLISCSNHGTKQRKGHTALLPLSITDDAFSDIMRMPFANYSRVNNISAVDFVISATWPLPLRLW